MSQARSPGHMIQTVKFSDFKIHAWALRVLPFIDNHTPQKVGGSVHSLIVFGAQRSRRPSPAPGRLFNELSTPVCIPQTWKVVTTTESCVKTVTVWLQRKSIDHVNVVVVPRQESGAYFILPPCI
jgi:hypothetical protein